MGIRGGHRHRAERRRIGSLAGRRVLVAGGTTSDGLLLAEVTVYDPASGSFVQAGQVLQSRSGRTATPLHDGRVPIAGGTTARRERDDRNLSERA